MSKFKKKGDPLPKTLAAAADELYRTRQERYAVQKVAADLKARESELEEHIIRELSEKDATGIAGKTCRVSIVKKEKPVVEDWDRVYTWARRSKVGPAIFQRRVNEALIKEIVDSGKTVPGVGSFTVVSLSVNKV